MTYKQLKVSVTSAQIVSLLTLINQKREFYHTSSCMNFLKLPFTTLKSLLIACFTFCHFPPVNMEVGRFLCSLDVSILRLAFSVSSYFQGRDHANQLFSNREFHSLVFRKHLLKIMLSSVHSLSCVQLFATLWTATCLASLSINNCRNLLNLMFIESMTPSNHLILCHTFLLLSSIFPNIRDFSNESFLCIKWPKYLSFSFSISPSNEYSGLISFRIDWFDSLAVQGTLKGLL